MPLYVEEQAMQSYTLAPQHVPMLAMSNAATRPTETKPRLAKEDVAFLERAFDMNHKPTTQTKRGYAENMGVDLPRINVRSCSLALVFSVSMWLTILRTGFRIDAQNKRIFVDRRNSVARRIKKIVLEQPS